MSLLREPILLLARSGQVRHLVSTLPVTAGVVAGYVAGETTQSAVATSSDLVGDGLAVTLDFLGEDTTDRDRARAVVTAYQELLDQLSSRGLGRRCEVSLKLSAVGQALGADGQQVALDNARAVCMAARTAGTAVTLDMEDHTTTERTLETLHELRKDFPETGAVIQASLFRSEDDCRALAHEGSRVRLCKGAYLEPPEVAHQSAAGVDRAFVRCLRILMAGNGYPMVATHDPRLVRIASSLAARFGRDRGSYEFQMLYGIRPDEQRRLAAAGETVRVYVPYGHEWYGYLMRRLAERPGNLSLFLKSLISKR